MDEFSLIKHFFKPLESHDDSQVILGIGDDTAVIQPLPDHKLLVSTDTLVEGVHFQSTWDPKDIAYRALMANISDMAAMGGKPKWITLALTLPSNDDAFLQAFTEGLREGLTQYNLTLVGGDLTRGPLALTITILGEAKAIMKRAGAKPGDAIYVSGPLGGSALAVWSLTHAMAPADKAAVMPYLLRPKPRVDLVECLSPYASSAIDISDGLAQDLAHICEQSQVGAMIDFAKLPLHPLIKHYHSEAEVFALTGGEDYELCFTIKASLEQAFFARLPSNHGFYKIGVIEEALGIRAKQNGNIVPLTLKGYQHF